MKTREQAEAAIRDLSAVTSTRQKHRESFETLVEYIKQDPEPESDDEVWAEISDSLVTADNTPGLCDNHWVITGDNHKFGLADVPMSSWLTGDARLTAEEIRGELREMLKAPVSTHSDATTAMARIFQDQKHGKFPDKKDITVVDNYLVHLSDTGCE